MCKQEPSSQDCPEFVDLEQCAAALEKDAAANGGSSFPGFTDLIGDDTSDAIITSDAFKDLISEISDFPSEFMKEFDFDGDNKSSIPMNDDLSTHQLASHAPPGPINQNRTTATGSLYGTTGPSNTVSQSIPELSPAAQTLKQMAEQHQHKTQLGLNYPSHGRNPNQSTQSAATPPLPQTPNIKQEIVYSPGGNPSTPQGTTRLTGGYSPYGSPSSNSHSGTNNVNSNATASGTTNSNMPRSQQHGPHTPQQKPQPPRPPSGPGPPNHSQATLQINQAQQLHISQSQGQPIQVTMAQNLQTDVKPSSLSVAAHQGLYFSQPNTGPTDSSYCAVSQSQTINFTQQTLRQRAAAARQHSHPHHQQGLAVLRPPPEYQSSGGPGGIQTQPSTMIHSMLGQQAQQAHRFPGIHTQAQQRAAPAGGRIAHQTMPPSGPMMRPQQAGVYMANLPPSAVTMQMQQQQRMSAVYNNSNMLRALRPPQGPSVVHIPPNQTGSPMDNNEWRQHLLMSHGSPAPPHQSRPNAFLHQAQGVLFGSGNIQLAASQMQQQQIRSNLSNNASRLMTSQQQQTPQPHQTLSLQQSTPQMSLNLHMNQQMSQFGRQHCSSSGGMNFNGGGNVSTNNSNTNSNLSCYNTSTGGVNTSTNSSNNNGSVSCSNGNANTVYHTAAASANNLNGQPTASYASPHLPSDLNLDFLEQLPAAPMDSSQIAQDILSSFDSGVSFNLNDIL